MTFDEGLAARIREELAGGPGLTERKMFGGLGFMVAGNMAVAASGEGGLMVRCAPEDAKTLLVDPLARPMEMRGRAMSGWLRVGDDDLAGDDLARWVAVGTAHARTLPPK